MGGSQNFVHGINREKIPRYTVYRGTLFCDSSKIIIIFICCKFESCVICIIKNKLIIIVISKFIISLF